MKANIPRLKNLITALQGAKPENFTMDKFGTGCGTPACVLGHYAARRDLQRFLKLELCGPAGCCSLIVAEDTALLFDAFPIQEHFGLSEKEAQRLFSPEGCGRAKTPAQAIAYIRKFIARKRAQRGLTKG